MVKAKYLSINEIYFFAITPYFYRIFRRNFKRQSYVDGSLTLGGYSSSRTV